MFFFSPNQINVIYFMNYIFSHLKIFNIMWVVFE